MEPSRILIVEDEAIIAMEVEGTLTNLGYHVTSIVNTGENAIIKAEEDRPDLILMDIRIKGELDGIETARIIRDRFAIPIVFSTAYLDQEKLKRARITMPFGYVLKPIQERELKVTMDMAIYVSNVDKERRETELALRKSEEFLKQTGQMAKIGGWESDFENHTTYWSPTTKMIHDVPDDYEGSIEDGIRFYQGKSRELIKNAVKNALEKGENYVLDLDFISAKNRHLIVRAQGITEFKDGKCKRLYGTIQDITDIRNAEKKVEEMNERLRLATTSAKIGVWDWNIQKNVLIWDDQMYRLYGVDRKEFTGAYEAWIAGLHPDDVDRCEAETKKVFNGKRVYEIEFRIIRPSGEIRHIKAAGETHFSDDGSPTRLIGLNYDITERKTAEYRLRQSEKIYRAAISMIEEATFLVNEDRGVTDFNDEWFKIQGFKSRGEYIRHMQTHDDPFDIYTQDGMLAEIKDRASAKALRGESGKNEKFYVVRKDIKDIWIGHYTYKPIPDDAGRIVGAVVVVKRVTELYSGDPILDQVRRKYL